MIPVFNEIRTVAEIVERTGKHVDRVVVVDDGSTDGSLDVLKNLDVHIVQHPANRGKGASLLSGMEAARRLGSDLVVTVDADGQHPPEYIPELLRSADPNTLVAGARIAAADAIPGPRLWANRTANFFISWAAGCCIQDTQCGFRVYPMALFDRVRLRPERRSGFVLESEVLIESCRAGFSIKCVPIPALYASVLQRPSHFRPVYDVSAIVCMVTGKLVARAFYFRGLIQCQKQRVLAARREANLQ